MNREKDIPQSVRESQRANSRARWDNMSAEERSEFARQAWRTRLARARLAERGGKAAGSVIHGHSLPE